MTLGDRTAGRSGCGCLPTDPVPGYAVGTREGHRERLLVECAICGETHDVSDPEDSLMLFWTVYGRVPVCGVCIADIVTPELERRYRDGEVDGRAFRIRSEEGSSGSGTAPDTSGKPLPNRLAEEMKG